jgi:hypothetical protein
MDEFIARLADATIGETFNFYRAGAGAATRCRRLAAYLDARNDAPLLLVSEAAGHGGAGLPTHPHVPGRPETNRRPTRTEIGASGLFLRELATGRRAIAVGRLAHAVVGGPYVRHPSHGGAADFRDGLLRFAVGGQRVRRFSVAV